MKFKQTAVLLHTSSYDCSWYQTQLKKTALNSCKSSHTVPPSPVQPRCSYLGVPKAFSEEDDLRNEVGVWHHHGDGTEHGLQVVWQLCAASVACTTTTHKLQLGQPSQQKQHTGYSKGCSLQNNTQVTAMDKLQTAWQLCMPDVSLSSTEFCQSIFCDSSPMAREFLSEEKKGIKRSN